MSKIPLSAGDDTKIGNIVNSYDFEHLSFEGKRHLAVSLLLRSLPEDPAREGLLETPARIAGLYDEVFAGYTDQPKDILATTFNSEAHQEMVIVKDIPFYSHCEHHMVPFFGKAHIAYIPDKKIVGISKLARLLDCYAKRFQIQERLSASVADDIMTFLEPLGVGVIIEAEHLCMTMRGIKKPGAKTITSAMRGVFIDENKKAREEFISLVRRG